MSTNEPDGPKKKKPISLADVETFGKTLLYLGRQIADVCEEIRRRKLSEIGVTGLKTAKRGRGYLHNFLHSMRGALDELVIAEESLTTEGYIEEAKAATHADYPAAMEKLKAKKAAREKR